MTADDKAQPDGVSQDITSDRDVYAAGRDQTINNRTVNNWGLPAGRRLERLNSEAGAGWLIGLPRDRAMDELFEASTAASAKVLKALWEQGEEALVISLLTDIEENKAQDLVTAVESMVPLLARHGHSKIMM
jgi:hypothetical protein